MIEKFKTAIVTDRTKIKAKLKDRGKPCHWLGYSPNHARGTYRLLNPQTRKIIQSRDVKFLNKSNRANIVPPEKAEPPIDEDDQEPLVDDLNYVTNSDGEEVEKPVLKMDDSTHDLQDLESKVEALSTALNMGEDLLDATTADAFNLNASARTKRRSKREKY